jgi:hypothetical protein
MESAITEAFLKSVQVSIDKCLTEVKEESRKFAAAINAVKNLPTASPVQMDTGHLEQRLATLELAYQRQVQKTIAGLSEDIGELDTRLSAIEKVQEEPVSTWSYVGESERPGPSKKNEVVVDDRTTEVDFGLTDLLVNVNHVEDDDVVMLTSGSKKEETVPVQQTPEAKPDAKAAAKPEVEPEPETEAEAEEEAVELEEFEHDGEAYYKDADNNLYKLNDDGEVDETPFGRWLEKKKMIKLY